MNLNDNVRAWLYIETVNYGIETLARENSYLLYPPEKEKEWLSEDFEERRKELFNYICNTDELRTPIHVGQSSLHYRYSIGQDIYADKKGVYGTYRNVKQSFTWNEIISIIKELLKEEPVREQMNMLDFLAEEYDPLEY